MQELTPLPKKIILLDREHMGVGKKQKELLNILQIKPENGQLKMMQLITAK